MKQDTYERMIKLRLPAMAQAYKEQDADTNIQALSFDQRLALLVDTEYDSQAEYSGGMVPPRPLLGATCSAHHAI